ncbi:MAG: nucleotidyl transferase AbiEii/AbiGii toxin family protein [Patescibacteria group bacterium]
MYPNILVKTQTDLLPLVKIFSSSFYLVGGTALALQLGHRRSIDFDLFTDKSFDSLRIRSDIKQGHTINRILIETRTEFTLLVDNVKMTFYGYPYPIEHQVNFNDIISLPDPLTIAAMKAFALGRRAKWKDYVDLFFIFQSFSLKELIVKAISIYKNEFDEKLFREQLAYYQDLDYSESVEYLPGFDVDDETIRQKLIAVSLS